MRLKECVQSVFFITVVMLGTWKKNDRAEYNQKKNKKINIDEHINI